MDILESLLAMAYEMAPYILLGLLIAGLLHAFVPSDLMSRHLAGSGWKAVVKAALIGVPLPLCSCGVLPTAVALRRSGASKAATSSFLISTPQTGVDSIAATWSLLGPAFAILRPIAAMTTAFFGGIAVGRGEKDGTAGCSTSACKIPDTASDRQKPSFMAKLLSAFSYGFFDMVQSIGGWLVVGLVIAAMITVLVPADSFAALGDRPLLAMLAVVAVAVPMYVCATGSIPIALSLMIKGLSPGTALVLLMAGPAANFASITILSRTLGRRSAAIYLASIIGGAMAFGLAVDYLMPREWFTDHITSSADNCHHSAPLFEMISAGILAMLLAAAYIARILGSHRHQHLKLSDMTKNYKIKGMNCPHCQNSVRQAIAAVEGVTSVSVDLQSGIATVEGQPHDSSIRAAVEAAGFDIADE